MKGYEAIADAFAREGVTDFFGLMGDGNMDVLVEASERHGARFYNARHEQGGMAMADGYARFSGKVAVATVTHGPGLLNAATAMNVARAHATPVVMFAGDTPTHDPDHIQAIDQELLARATAGTFVTVHSTEELADGIRRAFQHARYGDGPIVLNIPTDIQEATLASEWSYEPATDPRPAAPEPDAEVIARAAAALEAAQRPVILAGRGVWMAGAEDAVTDLAELLGAPMATTLRGTGMFSGHELHIGNAGLGGRPGAQRIIEEADCLLAIGAGLNHFTTANGRLTRNPRVVRVDLHPETAKTEIDLEVTGDASAALAAIAAELRARGVANRSLDPVREQIAGSKLEFTPQHGKDSVDPRSALQEIDRVLPDDRLLVIDAGHFISFATAIVGVRHPRNWTISADGGTIGQGLAASLGAAIARPGERLNVIVGDGAFLMGISELETAARYDVPVTVFVLNDEAYGAEVHILEEKGKSAALAYLPTPDLVRVAEGFGASGYRVASEADLAGLGDALAAASGPFVVDLRINVEVTSWAISELRGKVAADPAPALA